VALNGRDPGTLAPKVEALRQRGYRAEAAAFDVTDGPAAAAAIQALAERHGRLDVLVNNAGAPHGADRGEIETVPLEAWERVMAINARGVFLMTRAAVPPMKAQRWGRIISLSSVAGTAALPQRAAYSASKAAVIGLTRSVALDLARFGITVNAVCPGSIRTDRAISTTLRAGWSDVEAGLKERAKGIPVGRHGLPEEVAAAVVLLASDAGGFITGQAIVIDGGGLPPQSV
jgi:3-oxoacyl-[acyl-carrier protein] reductase